MTSPKPLPADYQKNPSHFSSPEPINYTKNAEGSHENMATTLVNKAVNGDEQPFASKLLLEAPRS